MRFQVQVAGGSEGVDTSRALGARERLYGFLPLTKSKRLAWTAAGGTPGGVVQTRTRTGGLPDFGTAYLSTVQKRSRM